MKQRVPDRIQELAAAAESSAPPLAPSSSSADDADEFREALPMPKVEVGRGGFVKTLERLRAAEAHAGALYAAYLEQVAQFTQEQKHVLASRAEASAEAARRSWEKLTKELRAYEKDAAAILESSGDSWVRQDVIKAMAEIHAALHAGVLGLLARVRPKLRGLPDAEQDALWRSEAEGLFSQLRRNKFTAPAPAEPPAE